MSIVSNYEQRYERINNKLFPTEFVVRWFKGNYPDWRMQQFEPGAKVLDLGFGDGRNFELFFDLGLKIYGLEISKKITQRVYEQFSEIVQPGCLRVGKNGSLPFEAGFFDFVVACHAIYYMDRDGNIKLNISEIARCMKKNGLLLFSIPKDNSYLISNSERIDDMHVLVSEDPLRLRNGEKLAFASNKEQILEALSPHFGDTLVCQNDNDWWGIRESCWIVSCRRL